METQSLSPTRGPRSPPVVESCPQPGAQGGSTGRPVPPSVPTQPPVTAPQCSAMKHCPPRAPCPPRPPPFLHPCPLPPQDQPVPAEVLMSSLGGGHRGSGSGLDGAHPPVPSCSALPSPPPSQPFQASPLPSPHRPSPVPTTARHLSGLRT